MVGAEGAVVAPSHHFGSFKKLKATERLTSDLREAISKISEVSRLLAPLTSNTSVNGPATGANSEVSESQSATPPTRNSVH